MANAWAQNWGPSLTGVGDDIGGLLKRKRQERIDEETIAQLLNLSQGRSGYNLQENGGQGMLQSFQNPEPRDMFSPQNMNLLNQLSPEVYARLLQTDQMNQPKYQEYSPGAAIYKQQRGTMPQKVGQVPYRPPQSSALQWTMTPPQGQMGFIKIPNSNKTVPVKYRLDESTGEYKKDAQGNYITDYDTGGTQPQPNINISGFGEREALKNVYGQLPKLRDAAMQAESGIEAIDKITGLVKESGRTGKPGLIKAAFAPWLELVGEDVPEGLSESETIQLLGRSVIGPMRLQLIGPGQVTEYEQKILERMSGKGATRQTLLELMNYYKTQADKQIGEYNSFLEGATSIDPKVQKLYRPKGKAKSSGSQGDKFSPGKLYKDAKGNTAKYLGNGKWESQ